MPEESWILVEIVDGQIEDWSGGGTWWSEKKERCVIENEDVSFFCSETEDIQARMNNKDTFQVKFSGVSFNFTPPHDSVNGFDPGETWLEYEDYEIIEAE